MLAGSPAALAAPAALADAATVALAAAEGAEPWSWHATTKTNVTADTNLPVCMTPRLDGLGRKRPGWRAMIVPAEYAGRSLRPCVGWLVNPSDLPGPRAKVLEREGHLLRSSRV